MPYPTIVAHDPLPAGKARLSPTLVVDVGAGEGNFADPQWVREAALDLPGLDLEALFGDITTHVLENTRDVRAEWIRSSRAIVLAQIYEPDVRQGAYSSTKHELGEAFEDRVLQRTDRVTGERWKTIIEQVSCPPDGDSTAHDMQYIFAGQLPLWPHKSRRTSDQMRCLLESEPLWRAAYADWLAARVPEEVAKTRIVLQCGSTKAEVDGKPVDLRVAPVRVQVQGGERVMIGYRDIVTLLKVPESAIAWDAATGTVIIDTGK